MPQKPPAGAKPKKAPASTKIVGPIPDTLQGGGQLPRADATQEYLASGGSAFPLVGQVILSHTVDDLTRDLGIQVYEIMLNDPTVASACNVLWTGILAGEFQILPAVRPGDEQELAAPGEKPKTPERVQTRKRFKGKAGEKDYALAHEIAEFCRRQVDRQERPIKQITMEFLEGMAVGTKLAEKVYDQGTGEDEGKVVLKRVRHKRNAAWAFVINPYGDIVAIQGLVVGGQIENLPPQKFMLFAWLPQNGDPRGRSILRPAYNGWNLKINTWPKYLKYLDIFGSPTIVGIAAPDAPNEPELDSIGNPTGKQFTPTQAMFSQLQRMGSASVAAIRAGSDVKFIQAVGNGEAFKNAFDLFKHEILEGILLSARATKEAKYGSKKDSESALDVVAKLIEFGRGTAEQMWEDQCFHQLVEMNWGKEVADLYTPNVSFGEVEQQDVADVAEAYSKLGYQLSPAQWPTVDAKLGMPVRDGSKLEAEVAAQRQQEIDAKTVGKDQVGNAAVKPKPKAKPKTKDKAE